MTDVGTIVSRSTEAHLSIEVGPVQVNSSAMLVHDIAYLTYPGLENTMSGGISDHNRGQCSSVFFSLGLEIIHIDIARFVTPNHNDLHTGQNCARRIRSVGRRRDEANITVPLPMALV